MSMIVSELISEFWSPSKPLWFLIVYFQLFSSYYINETFLSRGNVLNKQSYITCHLNKHNLVEARPESFDIQIL